MELRSSDAPRPWARGDDGEWTSASMRTTLLGNGTIPLGQTMPYIVNKIKFIL
jgi:hypothetical protein